jgi:antitoxin component YwqK of YwqJK toxin-antitoxin module
METKVELTYWENGQLRSETPRVGGKRHGMEKWWHPNGQLDSEYPYASGMLHGMMKYWHPNGQQESEQSYVDGKLHGMAKWWRQDGDVDEFCLYNQNEQVAKFYPRNQTQRWKLK